MTEDWINTEEAVKLSGYSAQYLRRIVRQQRVKAQKWGRDWQISRLSLLEYVGIAKGTTDSRKGPRT
jgi:hypothetical protein